MPAKKKTLKTKTKKTSQGARADAQPTTPRPISDAVQRRVILKIYDRLLDPCGKRNWWPGETPDEIIIGAVLTQNTAWRNVVKAIESLKAAGLLSLPALAKETPEAIAPLIRSSGYFNLKARRLHAVAEFFAPGGRSRKAEIEDQDTDALREALLATHGVGPETADSILVYALGRLSFVVDTYTTRVVTRHGLLAEGARYEAIRAMFTRHVRADLAMYNEYHALLVWAGHHYCKPKPLCAACPLAQRSCFATTGAWQALADARSE